VAVSSMRNIGEYSNFGLKLVHVRRDRLAALEE
jgi:hypothetical protein